MRRLIVLFALAGCTETTTPEGCPVMISEAGRELMQACQRAYHEEMARKSGGTVTKCFGEPGAMTCTTY